MVARRTAAGVVAAILLAPLSLALASPAAADAPTAGSQYVALGDSYASGFGLDQPTGEPVAGCGQTSLDYPHRVAHELHLDLVDVTCAGATTADVVDTRQLGAPPQVDALSDRTKLVTLTIGGNDADLVGTVSSCIAVAADGPIITTGKATCRATLDADGVDSLAASVDDTVVPGVERALAAITKAAPNARVLVVGYPALFPDSAHTPAAGCFRPLVLGEGTAMRFASDAYPFTATDVAYLDRMQTRLDSALRAASERAGVEYVSTLAASRAHSACATSGAYVQGVTLTADSTFSTISLVDGALHPNARGTAFLAGQVEAAVRAATAGSSTSTDEGGLDLIWLVLGGLVVVFAVILVLVARGIRRARRDAERDRR